MLRNSCSINKGLDLVVASSSNKGSTLTKEIAFNRSHIAINLLFNNDSFIIHETNTTKKFAHSRLSLEKGGRPLRKALIIYKL